jgi:hypothetical protein
LLPGGSPRHWGNQLRRFFGLALGDAGTVSPNMAFRLPLVALVSAALIWRLACAVA